MKKLLSLILSLTIILSCVSMINFAPVEVQAATTKSRAEAINYIKSLEGQWINYNNDEWGAQCVDLIWAYYNFLGVDPFYGTGELNSWDMYVYGTKKVPFELGWTKIDSANGFIAQPGDIALFTCGHVGLVVSSDNGGITTVEQNRSDLNATGTTPAAKGYRDNENLSRLGFCGVIRPHFSDSGDIVTPKPITYSTISDGTYYIKNNSNGEYISVSEAIDANGQNVNTWEFSENKFEQMILSKATSGYKMRPAICSSRLVNSYGDTVASGNNINIWDDVNDSSQWWGFEKVTGGYVIRNMMNSSCVMEVVNTGATTREMQVRAYHGGTSQIWSIQNAVTYNANGGSGAPATQMKNYDSTLTLSSTKPTRSGYTFLGWSTSSTATSATYSAGGSYTANKNVTLYAVWAKTATPAPTYTITYNANGGSGAPSSQTKTHGTALKLSSTKPTRDGYTFLGWSTSSSATSAAYSAGASFTSNASTTLYAVWGKNTYTISYDGNGATSGTTASQTTKTHTSTILNSNGFKKEITVFFDGNGGTSTVSSETQEAKFVGWMDLEDFHYNGYKWNWYTFDAPFYANNNSDLLNYFGYNKLGLIKHWITNTIERSEHRESSQVFDLKYYMSNGGSDLISAFGDDAMSYAYHWMTQGYAEGRAGIDSVYTNDLNTYPNNAEVSNLSLIDNDNITLTAKWKPITVTLPSATRSGYTFKGWNTKSDGSGTQYNAGATVTTDVNTTLYAVWETKTYTITYDANGGSGAPSAQTKTHGTALTLSTTKPTRAGYTFLGWATSSSATKPQYYESSRYSVNANTTLYAVWQAGSPTPTPTHTYTTDRVGIKVTTLTDFNGNHYIISNPGVFEADSSFTGTKSISYTVYNTSDKAMEVRLSLGVTHTLSSGKVTWAYANAENLVAKTIAPGEKMTFTDTMQVSNGLITVTYMGETKQYSLDKFFVRFDVTVIDVTAAGKTFVIAANNSNDKIYEISSAFYLEIDTVNYLPGQTPPPVTPTPAPYTYTVSDEEVTITDWVTNASGEITIPDTINGYPVTSIGDRAFEGCSNITGISIPSSVTSIGDWAFVNCNSLTSISIPKGVTAIGYNAFNKCSSLSSITIPDTVTYIGGSAFRGCISLKTINIPDSVTSIDAWAFYECTGLTSITLPKNIKAISAKVFYGCTNLNSVTIPASVSAIADGAFSGSGLKTVNFGGTRAQWDAITVGADNTILETVTVNCGQYKITYDANGGSGAPSAQTKIHGTALTLSLTEPTRDGYTFLGWATSKTAVSATYLKGASFTTNADTTLYAVWKVNTYTITYDANGGTGTPSAQTKAHGESIALSEIVPTREGYTFIKWAESTLIPNTTHYYLPGDTCSVNANITLYAVWEQKSFLIYDIKDGVATITGCDASASGDLEIPSTIEGASVAHIADEAFYNCKNLTSVVIPDSVTSIGARAFYGCSSLTSVTMGSGVISIAMYAFDGCTSLTEVHITDLKAWCKISFTMSYSNPLYYAKKLYLNNEKVEELIIPDGIVEINANAFYNCESLTSVIIPDGVTNIEMYAFYGCSNLVKATIPDGVTNIGDYAFQNNTKLESIEIPDTVTTLGSAVFKSCSNLVSVTVGDQVNGIGDEAFYNCKNLISVVIPDSVTSIGARAFYECSSLTSVTMGSGVTSIAMYAFDNCVSLTTVHITDLKAWCKISYTMSYSNPLYYAKKLYLNGEKVEELVIPDGIVKINANAFYNCESLTSVTIPDGVTNIEIYAFKNCINIKEATIPASVTIIKDGAFSGCGLENVYFDGTRAQWDAITVGSDNSILETVTVNCGQYKITYDANGGTGAPSAQTKTHGTALTLSSTEPTREGYTFLGWATSATATTAIYQAGESFESNADTTLYAVWEEIITPDPIPENAATVTVETLTARAGETVQLAVKLENNPGIWGLKMVVNYDKTQLTLTNVVNGEIFADSEWTKGNLDKETYTLSYSANDFADITTNGTLAILEFTVNENATADATTEVKLTYEVGDIINIDFDDIELVVVSGGVEVKDFIYGDLNSDGLINKKDELLMKMYIAELDPAIDIKAADVFYDGAINKKDELRLKQYLADWDVTLGN